MINSVKLKLLIPPILFVLSLILFETVIFYPDKSGTISVSIWFITIAFAVSCTVAIVMNVFLIIEMIIVMLLLFCHLKTMFGISEK